jgi:hypothetical protein
MLRLFDIRTFKEMEPLRGHEKEVTCGSHQPIENSQELNPNAMRSCRMASDS